MTLQMLFYESYITLISDINTRKRLQEKRTIGHWKVKVKVSCSVALDSAIPWTVATRLLCPWNSPGKNTGVGCQSLLQRIFPSQGLSPSLLHCRQILHLLSHHQLEWVAISFSNAWKWKVEVKLLSHVRLSNPMDCSLPGSSIHGVFQARVLEWIAIAFSLSHHGSP